MKFLLIFSIITNILADGILVVKDKNGSIIETSTIISSARIKKERAEKEAQLKAQKEKEEKERQKQLSIKAQREQSEKAAKMVQESLLKGFGQATKIFDYIDTNKSGIPNLLKPKNIIKNSK